MSVQKIAAIFCVVLLILTAGGCQKTTSEQTAKNSSAKAGTHSEISVAEMKTDLTDRDREDSYDSDAMVLDDQAETVTVTAAGTYLLSGSHRQIVIQAPNTAKIQLVLQNVTVTAQNEPALWIQSADKVFLTLAENSQNTFSDGSTRTTGEEAADGAIFSKADLTVNGSGSLTVVGNYKHGIVSKDDLVVCNANVQVSAEEHGLDGKDCLKLENANLSVNAKGDALRSTNEEDAAKGFVKIYSGSYALTAGQDGIQAQTALLIENGNFEITTGGGSSEASTKENGEINPQWGHFGRSLQDEESTDSSTESAKGLKAGTLLKIENGEFNINSADDSLHANGDVELNGGVLTLSSGDDGLHADSDLFINSGTLTVAKSYEGIEASVLNINGGTLDVTASDDGLNASGGNDGSSVDGRPGQNPFDSDSGAAIYITGGYLLVNASGDGIDSNGSLEVTGGVVLVSGPEDNGNGALDHSGTAVILGGVVVAVGSSGMVETFEESSTQPSISYTLNETQTGGTLVALTDQSGNALVSFLPAKSFNHVIVSAPELQTGQSYCLKLGGSITGADQNGFAQSGNVSDPTQNNEIELTGIVTDNGGRSGGFGGGENKQPDNFDKKRGEKEMPPEMR